MMPEFFDLKSSCWVLHVNKHECIYTHQFSGADVENDWSLMLRKQTSDIHICFIFPVWCGVSVFIVVLRFVCTSYKWIAPSTQRKVLVKLTNHSGLAFSLLFRRPPGSISPQNEAFIKKQKKHVCHWATKRRSIVSPGCSPGNCGIIHSPVSESEGGFSHNPKACRSQVLIY